MKSWISSSIFDGSRLIGGGNAAVEVAPPVVGKTDQRDVDKLEKKDPVADGRTAVLIDSA